MSLGYMHLFCDDGEAYDVGEMVVHEDFSIILEEHKDDVFLVKNHPRRKGEPRQQRRPLVNPMSLVEKHGLPIARLDFIGNNGDIGRFKILWNAGQPFPRNALPFHLKPTQKWLKPGYTGTLFCFSEIHRKRREEAGIYS